jgi:hypothetical protein
MGAGTLTNHRRCKADNPADEVFNMNIDHNRHDPLERGLDEAGQ